MHSNGPTGCANKIADLAGRLFDAEAERDQLRAEVEAARARLDALERVVKRIDTEHAEMCPQHTGLAAPPEPVAEPPMCYQIDCRYYGQRHATAHEPRETEAAGPVPHRYLQYPEPDARGCLYNGCGRAEFDPIHATDRK